MPAPKQGARLGSGPDHQKLLLAGICTSLFRQGSVKTTVARARAARPLAERMITFAKKGDIAARRRVGMNRVELDRNKYTVRFGQPGMMLDRSAMRSGNRPPAVSASTPGIAANACSVLKTTA